MKVFEIIPTETVAVWSPLEDHEESYKLEQNIPSIEQNIDSCFMGNNESSVINGFVSDIDKIKNYGNGNIPLMPEDRDSANCKTGVAISVGVSDTHSTEKNVILQCMIIVTLQCMIIVTDSTTTLKPILKSSDVNLQNRDVNIL